ncbi:hypothetical protein H7F15_01005 [Pontibacter sp. Tf4]|uniref:hypothetical protein n=1 Tax=Pontibacter sp. Tf4 TaxID=2761620 RepID=UPI001625FF68|nr:hypothetical protein [Pontibacter sp. Tf4]MBB6609604.1 hypothetical protein [Pontibacter sp. Tf4]
MLEIFRNLLITFFAVALLLPVVRFAVRRLLTGRPQTALTSEEMAYMQKQEWKLIWAYFFFVCILAVFSAGALAMVSSIVHSGSHNFQHLLTPNFTALFAPGLLLGITLAIIPLRLAQPTLLHHDYPLYKNYLLQTEGERSIRIWRILFYVMLALSAAVVWLSLQWHVTITEDQVKVNELFTDRTYAMTDIAKIEYLGKEGEYLITFNDNTNLNTTYLKPVQLEMIALLSEKSGKKVIR